LGSLLASDPAVGLDVTDIIIEFMPAKNELAMKDE